MDDGDIVTLGKHVAGIQDMNKAYPLLARRHQAGIRKGVKKMALGDFNEHLTSKEKKSIARRKGRYKKVYKGGKNAFSKKNSKVGKHVAGIRDMNKAYPLLARRHQAGIRKGVKKMASGDFNEHLTSKEKKSIACRKGRYKKVYKGGKNPFSKKNSKVGKTYSRFMKEVSFKEVSSSDSDNSATSNSSESEQ
jgi:hypothetical protein